MQCKLSWNFRPVYGIGASPVSWRIWVDSCLCGNFGLESHQRLRNSMFWSHVTARLTGWSFTSVFEQVDVMPAVGLQGLLGKKLYTKCGGTAKDSSRPNSQEKRRCWPWWSLTLETSRRKLSSRLTAPDHQETVAPWIIIFF